MNLAGDTFLRNDGGIQVKSSDLDVINSTFLGSPSLVDGISVDGGSANVSFSTIVLSILSYGRVSDSILLKRRM